MAKFSVAKWDEINGGLGMFSSHAPFRIVHHMTEGKSYAGARSTYKLKKNDPHFTVDGKVIYQHIDTSNVARALRNDEGGTETNRLNAVQIEVVGSTCLSKHADALESLEKLCRWIEGEHGVPQAWPNGLPRPCKDNADPGGHNRDLTTWQKRGGHYGHSQVPENTHYDPGYTLDECRLITPDAPEVK